MKTMKNQNTKKESQSETQITGQSVSSTDGSEEKVKASFKAKTIATVFLIFLAVIFLLLLAGVLVFKHYYAKLDYQSFQEEEWDASDSDGLANEIAEEADEIVEEAGVADEAEELSEEEAAEVEDSLLQNLKKIQNKDFEDGDLLNIMLIGVDSRADAFTGRSDSMILISINRGSKKILATSFLRDTYVSIPGRGSNRLNAAYAYGGASLLTETFADNYGIEIDRCVVVNFYTVMDFVDALGGVDLDLSADEIRVMNSYITEQNKLLGQENGTNLLSQSEAGMQHLNGNQALAYARVRYVGTDFARTGRQREVLQLCLEKVKTMSLGEDLELLDEFLPRVRTDLTESDCASLLLLLAGIDDYTIDQMTIPEDGTWQNARIRGMAVLIVDLEKNADSWYERIGK